MCYIKSFCEVTKLITPRKFVALIMSCCRYIQDIPIQSDFPCCLELSSFLIAFVFLKNWTQRLNRKTFLSVCSMSFCFVCSCSLSHSSVRKAYECRQYGRLRSEKRCVSFSGSNNRVTLYARAFGSRLSIACAVLDCQHFCCDVDIVLHGKNTTRFLT